MVVHFVAALESAHDDIETLRRIVEVIHRRGHSLDENWIDPQHFRHTVVNAENKHLEWDIICRQQPYLISESDIVIAEASGYSTFGVGYQVAQAKQFNKPTLLLTRSTPPYGAYIDGLGHGLIERAEYNSGNLELIIEKFIERYEY